MSASMFDQALLPDAMDEDAAGRRIKGIPGVLPPGETVLWRGRPCWQSLARQLCHTRGALLYFAVVLAGSAVYAALKDHSVTATALTMLPLVLAAAGVIGFLYGMAWLMARTTTYTLTSHRLVIRFGVALPAVLAIPYSGIAQASVTVHRDQTGDLPIALKPGYHVALHRTWPHSRPWRFSQPQPMLRSVPRAGQVATLLAASLARAQWARPECDSAMAEVQRADDRALVSALDRR